MAYSKTTFVDDSTPAINAEELNKIGTALENTLPKDETVPYTPIGNYNPTTKKYVDDLVALLTGGAGTATWGAILGTVTNQADLVAYLDSRTEIGSNANGNYVKFYDGTILMYGLGTVTFVNSVEAISSIAYPHAVINSEIPIFAHIAGAVSGVRVTSTYTQSKSTVGMGLAFRSIDGTVADGATIHHWGIIGRWK